jgi:putative MATE family efflux protein
MTTSVEQGEGPPSRRIDAPDGQLDRDIWAMAWPAMLSFVVVNVVDVIDVVLVGRLGRHTVAAWGYAAQCVHLVETLVQSVGIGCVALIARALGARDRTRGRRVLAASVLVSLTVALLGFAAAVLAPRYLFGLLDAEAAVIDIAVPYFRLFAFAMVLYAVAFMHESGLRAHRNTRGPLLVAVCVMTTKTVLSTLLVFGLLGFPRLELVGAGIATVAAHGVGLVLYVALCRRFAPQNQAETFGWGDVRAMWSVVREVLLVSLPSMGERLIMSIALLTYFKILSSYGSAAIAAYAIGVRLLSFSWVPGLGFSTAASTFVGQALGAGDSAGAKRAGAHTVAQAVLVMCVCGIVCLFARGTLVGAFTTDPEVAAALLPFMLMLAIAQPFMGAHFTLGGVLRGAGDTLTPLAGAAIGNWGFRVPLAWGFTRYLGHDIFWVWAALIADHFARMLVNGWVFLRGRWALRTGATLLEATPLAGPHEEST